MERLFNCNTGDITKISWYYGDTLTITFNLTQLASNLATTPTWMEDKAVLVDFLNFRYESVYSHTYVENDVANDDDTYSLDVKITPELTKLFIRGQYYCQLTLQDQEEDDEGNLDISTILPANKMLITVK